tara:strand:- start:2643 stop:4076 length:1434 start_codon:yes stop_codon:yes gene_type:complete
VKKEEKTNPISRVEIIQALTNNPTKKKEFLDEKSKSDEERSALAGRINAMLNAEQLYIDQENYLSVSDKVKIGKLTQIQSGAGFFTPDGDDDSEGWFIPKNEVINYIPGCKMMAQLINEGGRGALVGFVSLPKDYIAQLYVSNNKGYVVPPTSKTTYPISFNSEVDIPQGAWARLDFISRASRYEPYIVNLKKVLDDPSLCDSICLSELQRAGLDNGHSNDCLNQAIKACAQTETETKTQKDITHLPFISIDGPSSTDLDDIVYLTEEDKNGYSTLYVAISDVSRFVLPGSEMDCFARKQGVTIYSPGAVKPMLPPLISNDQCSLIPGPVKNVMVAEMKVLDGHVVSYLIYEATARSSHRFTYQRVQELYEGSQPTGSEGAHVPMIRSLYKMADKRASIMKEQGEIIVANREFYPAIVDNGNAVLGFEESSSHKSCLVIKELMVMDNVSAAKFLEESYGYGFFVTTQGHKKISGLAS